MKTYHLIPGAEPLDDTSVIVEEPGKPNRDLDPRLDLRNHSPTGFAWGYGGSGPAQLALAILADFFASNTTPRLERWPEPKCKTEGDWIALQLYQGFKDVHVSRWAGNASLTIPASLVESWVRTQPVEQWMPGIENAGRASRRDFDDRR